MRRVICVIWFATIFNGELHSETGWAPVDVLIRRQNRQWFFHTSRALIAFQAMQWNPLAQSGCFPANIRVEDDSKWLRKSANENFYIYCIIMYKSYQRIFVSALRNPVIRIHGKNVYISYKSLEEPAQFPITESLKRKNGASEVSEFNCINHPGGNQYFINEFRS